MASLSGRELAGFALEIVLPRVERGLVAYIYAGSLLSVGSLVRQCLLNKTMKVGLASKRIVFGPNVIVMLLCIE